MNQFQTLFALINDEIKAGTTNARNSATDALLWLKLYIFRSILIEIDFCFLRAFLWSCLTFVWLANGFDALLLIFRVDMTEFRCLSFEVIFVSDWN